MCENRLKVLFVDDEHINILLYQTIFSDLHNTLYVHSAREAMCELERDSSIKIIITDNRMPEITGSELLKMVVEKYGDSIKKIMVTANPETEEEVSEYCDFFFTKPVNINGLRDTIEKLIVNLD